MEENLLLYAVHNDVHDVDSSPFPNRASATIHGLMHWDHVEADDELRRILNTWEGQIRKATEQLECRVCDWASERAYFGRLRDRIHRRSALVTWIRKYLDRGRHDADDFGKREGLT